MNKKRAKFNFCFVAVLLVLALVLCFVSFRLPGSNNDYVGLIHAIDTTGDIASGYSAVYEITTEDVNDEEVEKTVDKMRSIMQAQGFTNYSVYRMGNYIKAEVNSTSNASTLLGIIGEPKSFFISATKQDNITYEELDLSHDLVGTDIENAYATTQYNLNVEYNGITIIFNEAGAEKFHKLSSYADAVSDEIYFYIDGVYQTSLEISETTNNYLSFYSSSYTSDTAKAFALQILMASTGVNVKSVSISQSSPTLGSDVLAKTVVAICTLLIAILVLFPVLFGDLGFVADLSMLFGGVFTVFFLQALPITTMSSAGLFGVMTGFALMAVCHYLYLNKMKNEFKFLNRMQLAAKTSFKKSWLKILDLTVIPFIFGVIMGLWKVPYIASFGICLAIVSFVTLFNIVILFKDFIAWYLYINSKNYKRVKFTKGEGNE